MDDLSYQNEIKDREALVNKIQIFLIIQEHGPRSEDEIYAQLLRFKDLLRLCFISIIHAVCLVSLLLLTYYAIENANFYFSSPSAIIIKIIGSLILIIAIFYSTYGAGIFQSKFLFRGMDLLSIYRMLSYTNAYRLYSGLGMLIGGTLVALLNYGPWALLPDYESAQKTIILYFGSHNIIGSFSCILRTYLVETQTAMIVSDWVAKWKKQSRLENNPLEQAS